MFSSINKQGALLKDRAPITRIVHTRKAPRTGREVLPPASAIAHEPDKNVMRYEQLAHAAKAFIFTVLVREGHSVGTIRYPGCAQVTGYTEAEYEAQPLLWITMVPDDDRQLVTSQITRLLRGETPSPINHRVMCKDGSIHRVRNTSVPVFDSQGQMIAYDGLVMDISGIESAELEQTSQTAELATALALVKTLHGLLPICSSCKRIRDDKGYWQQIEAYIAGRFPAINFTHSICPDCIMRLYPEYYRKDDIESHAEEVACADSEKEIGASDDKKLLVGGENRHGLK